MSWWTEEKQRREGKKEGEGKGRRRKRNGLCAFAKIAAGAHTWSRGRWPGLFDHVHANHCCRAPGSVSVRPPVCPSVRYWYWLKTDDRTIMQFTPSGRPWSLSFSDNNFHTLDPRDPLANASNETGWAKWRKNASFSINKSLHLGNDRRTEKWKRRGGLVTKWFAGSASDRAFRFSTQSFYWSHVMWESFENAGSQTSETERWEKKQELSYRKQIERQLRTQYVEASMITPCPWNLG